MAPRRSVQARLHDMLTAIDDARAVCGDHDAVSLTRDRQAKLALERAVEIISEASRHLPDDMKGKAPTIPWRQIADVGNVLRHGYEIIDPAELIEIVHHDLDQLEAFLLGMREGEG